MPFTPIPVSVSGDFNASHTGAVFSAGSFFLASIWGYQNGPGRYIFRIDDSGISPNASEFFIDFSGQTVTIVVNAGGASFNQVVAVAYFLNDADCALNALVSIDLATPQVQVYINDVAASLDSGGLGPAHIYPANTSSAVSQEVCTSASYISELWVNAQPSFVDLSIQSNRRKFINADLTPVDLGSTGQNPFGSSPKIFRSISSGDVANDWLTNLGSASANLTLNTGTLQLLGNPCSPPPSGAADVGELFFAPTTAFVDLSLEANRRKFVAAVGATQDLGPSGANPFGVQPPVFLTRYEGAAPNTFAANAGNGGAFAITGGDLTEADIAPPCAFEGAGSPWAADAPIVWLRWSDDRGRTWSNPIPQSIGATGAYLTQVQWNRTGMARDRIFEVYGTVPGRMAVNGAWLDPEPVKLRS